MYPPAPLLFRECVKDYQVRDTNLIIPQGTPVMIPVFNYHRDPAIYDDPLVFRPERFLNNPVGTDKGKGLFYLPFGDGPRNCIGMRMGKLTTKLGLALMLAKFNFELNDKSFENKELEFHPSSFVLAPVTNFDFRITSR